MGVSAESLTLPAEVANIRELVGFLESSRPPLRGVMQSVRFAVGDEFVGPEHELHAGDVVALIPPVSGG